MKKKFSFVITILLSASFLLFLTQCAKNVSDPQKEDVITKNSVKPLLQQGPCPYDCHDIRCEGYSNGYCGPLNPQQAVYTSNPVTNQAVKDSLKTYFLNLSSTVNFATLSTQMGLPHTLTVDSLDFVNVTINFDANNNICSAIVANFKGNSNNRNTNYCFTVFYDGSNYFNPTFISTTYKTNFKLFNCSAGYVVTCNNCTSSNWTMFGSDATYMGGTGEDRVGTNSVGEGRTEVNKLAGCGQAVMDCMTYCYTGRGWLSVINTVVSAFYPPMVAGMAAGCALKFC
jgi:hypothetical protein